MSTGQMMLTICAVMMLSMLSMRTNSNILETQEVMQNSKYGLLAISLATSIIEEANNKAFDNSTVDSAVSNVNGLTLVNRLGPESGETYSTFNDFDDYNNYSRTDSSMPSAQFNISCQVKYIDYTNPDSYSTNRTFHKKILVSVSSPAMTDTIKLGTIYSYWTFR